MSWGEKQRREMWRKIEWDGSEERKRTSVAGNDFILLISRVAYEPTEMEDLDIDTPGTTAVTPPASAS